MADEKKMTDSEIREAVLSRLTIPLVVAGRALGLKPGASRAGAKEGRIPTVGSPRKRSVPCSWLAEQLRLTA